METALLLLAIPLVAAGIQGVVGAGRAGRMINLGAGAGTFAAALALAVERPVLGGGLILDELNLVFVLLTAFVGLNQLLYVASGTCGAALILTRVFHLQKGCAR